MVRNLWYLALAYGVVWASAFGYLLYLVAQARELRREVNLLTRVILQAEAEHADRAAAASVQPAGNDLD